MRRITVLLAALALGALTGCAGLGRSSNTPPPQQQQGSLNSINHIVIMVQENRSFDHYFGAMTAYRQKNNIPINSADGKIRDLSDAVGYTNPGPNGPVAPYHTGSVCTENLSPDWAEHHIQVNSTNPAAASPTNFDMKGFVRVAFGESQFFATKFNPPILLSDQDGHRAMGFFDETQLNYYYFMAANFGMSDNLHSPLPANTTPNRMFLHAATSQGWAHIPGAKLTSKTIWQALDEKGITWKIYRSDDPTPANPFQSYLSFFTYWDQPGVQAKVFPLSQYLADVQAGTLPSVAFIEAGYNTGRDEHTSNVNPAKGGASPESVQVGAAHVASIINALMASPSWKDSVFLFAFDEGGGAFDHAPPIAVPNPDGIPPRDLCPTARCPTSTDPPGDFTMSGVRVPNMVISPFAKKNFVSHTPMDYTAFLKLIETRFGLTPLTQRDASMPDMTEFFDFTTATGPWATPPTPPQQLTSGACNFALE